MAFDGFTICEIAYELKNKLLNGKINKISQPSNNELLLIVHNKEKYRLLISIAPNLPLIYLSNDTFSNPSTPPAFTMLLRKLLQNAKITDIEQVDFDRCIKIKLLSHDEMGYDVAYTLVCELTGRNSNVILVKDDIIVDAIKHIPKSVSRVRQVIPGEKYFFPKINEKINPLSSNIDLRNIESSNQNVTNSIANNYIGISKTVSREILYRNNIDFDTAISDIDENAKDSINNTFRVLIDNARNNKYKNTIYKDKNSFIEYNTFELQQYSGLEQISFDSVSEMIETFYKTKRVETVISQRTTSLRVLIDNLLSRAQKKYQKRLEEYKQTEKMDKYKLYGELLLSYNGPSDTDTISVNNYYENTDITIPIDKNKSIIDNSNKYYKRYNKLKRAKESLETTLISSKDEIEYLENVRLSLSFATCEDDINQIKDDLYNQGYIKKSHARNKKDTSKAMPIKVMSCKNHEIYIGKNNIQNDYIVKQVSSPGDYWFHTKNIPGSHVLLKLNGDKLSDEECLECASLAAFYSKASKDEKVEVDYLDAKGLKRVKNKPLGFVIYHENYSIVVEPKGLS